MGNIKHVFQKEADGKYHIPITRSPEYPTKARDTNYNIGLIRWLCQRLLEVNRACNFNDPQASEWQDVLDNLVDYQIPMLVYGIYDHIILFCA